MAELLLLLLSALLAALDFTLASALAAMPLVGLRNGLCFGS